MATKKFLLVCEGPTDIEILSSIANSVSNFNGHVIQIAPLSPQLDATSGKYPRHGWTAVQAWCKANRKKQPAELTHLPAALQAAVLRKDWRALVAASGAEGLIVQIDTDIAECISDLPIKFVNSSVDRRTYTESAILNWLAEPEITHPMFLVLSTHSTETWILACHDPIDPIFADLPEGFNYENITDIEQRLIKKGFATKKEKGVIKLKKSPAAIYKKYGGQITAQLPNVRMRCQEANVFCSFLEAV